MARDLTANNKFLTTAATVTHGIGTGNFTVGGWVYANAYVDTWNAMWTNGSFAPAMYFRQNNSTGTTFRYYDAGVRAFDTVLTTGQWYHCMVRRSGTTVTGWVNGVQETTTHTLSTSYANVQNGLGTETIAGSRQPDARYAEWALWTVALTAAEIACLARRVNPKRVRPGSQVYYWPLYGTGSPEPDLGAGNYPLTLNGAPPRVAHAPVSPPLASWSDLTIAAAAGGGPTLLQMDATGKLVAGMQPLSGGLK